MGEEAAEVANVGAQGPAGDGDEIVSTSKKGECVREDSEVVI